MKSLMALFLQLIFILNDSIPLSLAGYAPDQAPDLPDNFCPSKTGAITRTTGECMCHWQDKKGCNGSGCQFEMGLSWYHYTCKDCKCVPEP